MASPPNVLFYSKNCIHCKKFGQMLYKLPNIDSQFVKISVDVKNIKLPNYVKLVPTIVVFDDFKQKHILDGSKAFEWLNQFLEDASKVEITCYDEGVMGSSLSDNFSFLNEEEETEHTFAFLDQMYNTQITVPMNDSTNSSSKVSSSEIERYKAERDRNVPSIQKQQHVDFTKGFEQSGGPHRLNQSDVEKFKNLRTKQIGRKPPPKKAPNFESSTFNPSLSAQSKRGGYVPYGGSLESRGTTNKKEQIIQSRLERLQSDRDNLDKRFGRKGPTQIPAQLQSVSTNPRAAHSSQSQSLNYNPNQFGRQMPRNSNFRTL